MRDSRHLGVSFPVMAVDTLKTTDLPSDNLLVSTLRDVYLSFAERRDALGLSNPGTVENIAREVQKDVFLNNYTFTSLRADLTKAFSATPLFQISHAFSMGSQALPPYTFAAIYGTSNVSLWHGSSHAAPFSDTNARYFFKVMWITTANSPRGRITDGHHPSSPRATFK